MEPTTALVAGVLFFSFGMTATVIGAIVNLMFIEHFQDMARGHFVIWRLERKYGMTLVESIYRSL